MKRYKLPEVLGGGEAELVQEKADGYPSFRAVQIDGLVVLVPSEHLTEAVPPLPKEPRAWSVVAVVDPTAVLTIPPAIIFQRWTSGWFRAGYDGKHEWPEVCALGTPTVIWTTDGDS